VWDARTWREVVKLGGHDHEEGHEDHVRCCTWSPDGARLATAAQDATVRVWDVETWQAGA